KKIFASVVNHGTVHISGDTVVSYRHRTGPEPRKMSSPLRQGMTSRGVGVQSPSRPPAQYTSLSRGGRDLADSVFTNSNEKLSSSNSPGSASTFNSRSRI